MFFKRALCVSCAGVGALIPAKVLITIEVRVTQAYCGLGVWTAVSEPNTRLSLRCDNLLFCCRCSFTFELHSDCSVIQTSQWRVSLGLFIQLKAQLSLWKLLTVRSVDYAEESGHCFWKHMSLLSWEWQHSVIEHHKPNSIHHHQQIKPKLYLCVRVDITRERG